MECQTAEAMTTPMVKGRRLPDSRNESGRARMRPAHEARAIGLQRLMASSVGAGRRILETATRASSVLSRPTAAMPSSTRPITTSQECRTVGLSAVTAPAPSTANGSISRSAVTTPEAPARAARRPRSVPMPTMDSVAGPTGITKTRPLRNPTKRGMTVFWRGHGADDC